MRLSRNSILTVMLGLGLSAAMSGSAMIAAEERPAAVWPTQGWQTSTPEEQGMDPAALAGLLQSGMAKSMDSLLIVRHGRIVLDAYYAPYSADLPHVVNSVTKAVIGTLTSMALRDGVLKGTDQPPFEFFGDRHVANPDGKKAITLQNLLDMTSGLAWEEGLGSGPPLSVIEMERSRNWVDFILNRPMVGAPGEGFNYNSGNPHLLSAILSKVTGRTTEEYARDRLFGPLGITSWKWRRDPQGVSTGGYGLSLHPRDMAKFGYLYLRNGEWDGQQLVPREWIDKVNHATVDMHLSFAPAFRYSNFFWAHPDANVYWASGYRCQLIVIYPALDLVAVTTGRDGCAVTMLLPAIAAAVKSPTAIATDPAGTRRLASAIQAASTETPTAVREAPAIAAALSGKVYRFASNPLGVKSFSLTLVGPNPHYDFELYSRNASRPAEMISGPIGLDGLYRKGSDTPYGPLAVRGVWLDDHVFEVERINIGASELSRKWTLSFDGDKVNLRGRNYDGADVVIDGQSGG